MRRSHDMPFGAQPLGDGRWRFRIWAPAAESVELAVGLDERILTMAALGDGWYGMDVAAPAGTPYRYRINGQVFVPDPASRSQRDDVHGPSVLVDSMQYAWNDDSWSGRPWEEAVIYELHVGSFTPEGTFAGVESRLDYLASLGVTAIELMPVADFPGARDWGYDGALLFSPDKRYGTPDDLKRLVEAAHRCGLMVLLDVVYNHFGPEGNYLHLYAPQFFTERHCTPWGAAVNFEGERTVREFFIHNALFWIEEYHLDGLRFDAIHAVRDDSSPDIVEELGARVRERHAQRHVHLVIENDGNVARYMELRRTGRAYDAQWNDDFHHAMHAILTGESGGYYVDVAKRPHAHLARSLKEGFAFQGEHSVYRGAARGSASAHLPLSAFVGFLQNHDQIGNRAFGERLTVLTSAEALRAATAITLLAPAPPLIFMGQEWGSRRPFLFFCDFSADLAPKVTAGRRKEFARFLDFSDPARNAGIPDPQAFATFETSRLAWEEAESSEGGDWLRLHRHLLRLRLRFIAPRLAGATGHDAEAICFDEGGVAARWRLQGSEYLLLVANLCAQSAADVALPEQGRLYATPEARYGNGALGPWAVAWFLAGSPINARQYGRPLL